MAKLCLIYNFAQHYRAEIFQELDKTFDVDFYFGDKYLDVKKMDYSLLRVRLQKSIMGRLARFYISQMFYHSYGNMTLF